MKTVEDSLVLFKYKDLKRTTNNFSEKLGEGGPGSVLKGIFIAVKELKTLNQVEKQFHAEAATVGAIQHVSLVGSVDFAPTLQKDFLVYDYMPNGSLQSLLRQKNPLIFDWIARYHIAIGTARGLAYFHEECRDRIIHCDIKPDNILLDAEYSPKLGDFGLARLRACKVVCWCIQDDEKDRQTMRQVVQILEGVSDVSVPPIPQLLQRLTESTVEVIDL